ncbi:MAG: hypothetical protein U5R06_02235 [candidate division KSB1 bacterium]|nr:hypothetical protein [candidate division KSB1 bacterium]
MINGVKYAETNDEFVNFVFDPDGACEGRVERHKRKIIFRNISGKIDCKIDYHGVLLTRTDLDIGNKTYYPVWIPPHKAHLFDPLSGQLYIDCDKYGMFFK